MTDVERLTLEAMELQRQLLQEIRDLLAQSHWTCGCSHVNGANLAVCANCGRSPGDRR
jgi:hypothetical protein